MKKISALILAATLAMSPSFTLAAQNQAATQAVAPEPSAESATADDASETVIAVSSIDSITPVEAGGENDFLEEFDNEFFAGMKDGMNDTDFEEELIRNNMGFVVAIMGIIFGIPCLAIIAALVVILVYALKRNKRRNEIILAAIANNYQLPDSFYTGQKSGQSDSRRDPKKFYSAVTFISIGIGLIVFGIAVDAPFFQMCGCIPMCIGIGRMIGYFYVTPSNRPTDFQQPPFPPQQPPFQQPQWTPQPPMPQTPPPYNPSNRQ